MQIIYIERSEKVMLKIKHLLSLTPHPYSLVLANDLPPLTESRDPLEVSYSYKSVF